MNFAAPGQTVDYVLTGHWGKTAIKQVSPYVRVNVAASSEAGGFHDIPPRSQWQLSDDAAYVHITANETIHGVEFRDTRTSATRRCSPISAPPSPANRWMSRATA